MQQIYVNGFFKDYKSLCAYSLKNGDPLEGVITRRLKIIDFYGTYGAEATKEAFGISRSTVYLWASRGTPYLIHRLGRY